MKRLIGLALALGLIAGFTGSAGAKAKKKPAPKPVIVMEDATGDAGNQDAGIPGVDQMGVDLVSATIFANAKNLEFTVTHSAMSFPQTGSLPEFARFLWHFKVDDTEYRFTVKSFDIGKPDVVAQSGTERVGQVYPSGVYRLEECTADATLPVRLNQCVVVEYLEGSFDPTAKTFTIIVPMATVKAKPGTAITGSVAVPGCMMCWVPHYAERSLTPSTIIDSAAQAVTYVVPK